MSFAGLKKATQRADVLAYFRTFADPASQRMGPGNAARGKAVAAKRCRICHSFDKGGKMVFGPNLFGVFGQPAGAVKGYKYSPALLASGLRWTDANLIEFLADPEQFIKGTKAQFPGIKSSKMRADIIAYLKTLK
jgi:cytochrome c